MNEIYIGLDTATTTGISLYIPKDNLSVVTLKKGNPIEQLDYILDRINGDFPKVGYTFVLERQHYFRNAKSIRSLVERYGYLKHSLLREGYRVEEVSPDAARKTLGVKGKQGAFDYLFDFYEGCNLTDDHTDALAVALHQAKEDGCTPPQWDGFRIVSLMEWH